MGDKYYNEVGMRRAINRLEEQVQEIIDGGGTGGTRDYNELIHKPAIDGVELNSESTLEGVSGISEEDISSWNEKTRCYVDSSTLVFTK